MRVGALAILLLISVVVDAPGGDCVQSADFYLECLEGKRIERCIPMRAAMWCVGVPRRVYHRWALPSVAQALADIREIPYRDRLIAAAHLHLSNPDARVGAIQVIAFQGIEEIDGIDVFEEITSYENYEYIIWYVLAGLQDPRTICLAEDRYLSTDRGGGVLDTDTRDDLMDIVDCLYHFQTDESRDLLRRLGKQETDAETKAYIAYVAGASYGTP